MPSYSSYKRVMDENSDDITWITVRGNRVPIKKGQAPEDAIQAFIESKQDKQKSGKASGLLRIVVKPVTDIKGYRKTTLKWYKENLQGKSVNHPKLGNILFSLRGGKHVLQVSATNKLALVRYLPQLIRNGDTDGWKPLNKHREDSWIAFAYVQSRVIINQVPHAVGVVIAKDKNGNIFYDIGLNEKEGLIPSLANRSQAKKSPATDNIDNDGGFVNLFIEDIDEKK